MLKITFMGAAGTVTGSKHAITYGDHKILIDCGLFQGQKELRQRNWERLPVKASDFEAVVLTHAHIDHSGYLPRLVRDGYAGKILCTHATKDLCKFLLPDSARIQEEEADYLNRKNLTSHKPALPLYTEAEAVAAVNRMVSYPYNKPFPVIPGVKVTFHDAGHILGSSWLEVELQPLPSWPLQRPTKILFSGDLGREDAPILRDPEGPIKSDFLILESTYGDRLHSTNSIEDQFVSVIREAVDDKGVILIPAFAVERTQEILYILERLSEDGELPKIPVFVDSPMATGATKIYDNYPEYFDEEAARIYKRAGRLFQYPKLSLCETVQQSKAILNAKPPFIVISASGMATGGRVLHHLRNYLPHAKNRVLLVGYQSVGTRGWRLQNGESEIKIFGEWIPVQAQVISIDGFSGHADYQQINRWLEPLPAPFTTFLVHGEPASLKAQQERIRARGWNVHVPDHGEEVTLF